MSWRERSPGPFTLWARYEPKSWPRPSWPHVDPLAGAVRTTSGGAGAPDEVLPRAAPEPADATYLPPTEPEHATARDELAARIAAAGGHALVHLRAGESVVPLGATAVVDLIEPLARGFAPAGVELPRGAWVLFPLVAGLATNEIERSGWLARLALADAASVVGVQVALAPSDRRVLADLAGEERWQAIFHGEPPGEQEFARAVAASGLAPLPPLPAVEAPPRAARNRALAALLAEAGELTLRLGKAEAAGGALIAAARRANASQHDLAALAREGNLGVLDWLDESARELIAQAAASGFVEPPQDLARLRREWRGEGEAAP
jgi:hypothetical protein